MEALRPLPSFQGRRGPVLLCVLDGVAYGKYPESDAVLAASTPTLDWLHKNCPATKLKAHGLAVGMPSDGDMGNSEVGHNAIGAGRVFAQGAKLVNDAINDGTMFEGKTWQELINNCLSNDSTLHLIGLLSDGNVHSHVRHVNAMVDAAAAAGIKRLRLHPLLDGRDVGEDSALNYVIPMQEKLAALSADHRDFRIASGGGRMFITMDRYNADWEMVRRGWETHVLGIGRQFASADAAITMFREETPGIIDQDLPAFVIAENGQPVGTIEDGDSVIMFNFRGDRAIELSTAFEADAFDRFDRQRRPDVVFAGMMEYDPDTSTPSRYLVSPPTLDRTVGEFLSAAGKRQLAISETQKFGHVTYFFNGNRSNKFNAGLETYIEVPSDNVSFDQRPWMKAAEITDAVINALASGDYDFMRINYPNGDMVGHTGDFLAAEISVETVDLCLKRLMKAVKAAGGVLVVCADHGNADQMYEHDKAGRMVTENGKPKSKTSHTLNPVPCIVYDPENKGEYSLSPRTDLGITSLATTCLNLLGFEAPDDYDPSVLEFGS